MTIFGIINLSFCQINKNLEKGSLKNYCDSLECLLLNFEIDTMQQSKHILDLMPSTEDEYLCFYSMSYPDKSDKIRQSFEKYNSAIDFYLQKGDKAFFYNYLVMSEFVDGEYAEVYFDNLDYYIERYKTFFCKLISDKLSKLRRVDFLKEKYCQD